MARKKQQKLEQAVYLNWEESERGWGTRPDGCSLHLTEEDAQQYVRDYAETLPKEVPNEYERPAGVPVGVTVTKDIYRQIRKSKNGIRLCFVQEKEYAKIGKLIYGAQRSGWVPVRRI
jgi:hypothetical protein